MAKGMAKRRSGTRKGTRRKVAKATATAAKPYLPPGLDPATRLERREITSAKDAWSVFELDDGTTIRVKALLVDVKRAVGQFNLEGVPVYRMEMAFINSVDAPVTVRRNAKKTRRRSKSR